MPKGTAVWLVENTALTFEQVADFCGLHALEVQAIADDEVAFGMQGMDPIAAGELTQEELDRCAADPSARLNPSKDRTPVNKQKGARYTPVSKRQDRPDAIAWLVKSYPELSDAQISRLIGTTKPTINSIRDRTHWNITNIKPQNPVGLGLCSGEALEKILETARKRAKSAEARKAKEAKKAAAAAPAAEQPALLETAPEPDMLPKPEPEPLAIEQQSTTETIDMPAPEAEAAPIEMPATESKEEPEDV
ncbi:MAG: cell cycle transcriptional regulator TrcR [Alphaproteobacteria bacterium]